MVPCKVFPIITIFLTLLLNASNSSCIRHILLENILNIILPSLLIIVSFIKGNILWLGLVKPFLSAYNDSLIRHNTPCFPTYASLPISVLKLPLIVGSNIKLPVYTIAPSLVFITYPTLSGSECVIAIGNILTFPKFIFLCGEISIRLFATTL